MSWWLCCFAVFFRGGIGGFHCNVHAVHTQCKNISRDVSSEHQPKSKDDVCFLHVMKSC